MKTNKLSLLDQIRTPKTFTISLFVVGFYGILALLTSLGWLAADYALVQTDLSYSPPSIDYFFGTDFLGRSVLSRALKGSEVALIIGFFAATLSTLIGLALGLIGAYFSGWVDDAVVWLYTTLESIPYILLIAGLSFAMGPGLNNLYIALGLTSWVSLCRLVRAEVYKQKCQDYMAAAESVGASHLRRILYHILPNVYHIALIQFTLNFIYAIKIEVILSFLGLGVEPGVPSWGLMINEAKDELTSGVWWGLASATTMMFILVLAVNLLVHSLNRSQPFYNNVRHHEF